MVHSKIDLLLVFFHVGGDANMGAGRQSTLAPALGGIRKRNVTRV
jgi:hypothetical protein